jgi:hypothetical protein
VINRYTRELMVGGALTGGAAAAPVAGLAIAAATTGADITYSMGKLSAMIMAVGLAYRADPDTVEERSRAVWAILGMADTATAGVTGLAARIGSRGGSRLLSKLPTGVTSAAGSKLSRRAVASFTTGKGPWSLTSLVPYGIGAGVGAAGNALLARSVGRAAKQYFAANSGAAISDTEGTAAIPDLDIRRSSHTDDQIVDAEIVEGPTAGEDVGEGHGDGRIAEPDARREAD